VKSNAESAQETNEVANEARAFAESNVSNMNELKESVESIRGLSKKMTTAIQEIKQSSDSIAKIIKTIDEIAFQTNILALNAAVEAARAGEAGMGFAVVADEVRNLAKRCSDAAKETEQIIQDSIHKSEIGVKVNEDVSKNLEEIDGKAKMVDAALLEILNKFKHVDENINQIAQASKEQSQGVIQINSALVQMDKVTQNNASSAEAIASAATELNGHASEMENIVKELVDMVESKSKRASARPQIDMTVKSPVMLKTKPSFNRSADQSAKPALMTTSLKTKTPDSFRDM
jgi:methyl-accepting chemotaxis protein